MRRLILMRHAKSSWNDAHLPDKARPLARRGRLAAPLMAAWLGELAREGGFALDHVVLSDSLRTRQTWAAMLPVFGAGAIVTETPELYEATPEQAAAAVALAVPEAATTVLALGHNPGLGAWASALAQTTLRFPTAATAILSLDAPWSALGTATARLLAYEEPKTLV